MNYLESVNFIKGRPPVTDMNTILLQQLLKKMGHPENKLKFVHVTGTNGKGSISNMIATPLIEAGYTVGAFNSPYINSINEYFRVNGKTMNNLEFTQVCNHVKHFVNMMEFIPSEFELCVAVALEYFVRKECDIVILEVGMGGRRDATNVIPAPLAAVFANIGLDHVGILGNTIGEIAAEKAGIIKPGCDVISYMSEEDALKSISEKARICKCRSVLADFSKIKLRTASINGQHFAYKDLDNLFIRLVGEYQLKNAAVAIETLWCLREKGFDIPDAAIRRGLKLTRWPCRFEILKNDPVFILEGAHNVQGIKEVCRNFESFFPDRKLIFIVGVMADKDYMSMFGMLAPYAKCFICVEANNPRAMRPRDIAVVLKEFGKPVYVHDIPSEGVREAYRICAKDDVICAIGSFYMMRDIMKGISKYSNQAKK